ncbi:MAG: hypothetical protein JNM89_03520 [Hyphomicrobiaceae bacterium]|nr:hypothetical protein [Hyphomicrobiaceae bacterium]
MLRSLFATMTRILAICALASAPNGLGGGGTASAEVQDSLAKFEQEVARDYPAIAHVAPVELEAQVAHAAGDVLLIDARGVGETDVSRLPGAIPVDPDIATDAFVARFAEAAKGRDVVIYCSVGVRSSKLAARVRDAMIAQGARRVANLRGGIFAVHNARRKLVDSLGETYWVHPYSWWWSRYLERRELTRYEPRSPLDGPRPGDPDGK